MVLLIAALLALVSMAWLQAVWLGRLDPKQVTVFWAQVLGQQVLGARPHL